MSEHLCRECRSDNGEGCYCDKLDFTRAQVAHASALRSPDAGEAFDAFHNPPSIPEAWDLITAGGGRHYHRSPSGDGWRTIDQAEWVSDSTIAALGPVRRAVVVTVPNIKDVMPADLGRDAEDRWVFGGFSSRDPEYLRKKAAELIAAALHAEEASDV